MSIRRARTDAACCLLAASVRPNRPVGPADCRCARAPCPPIGPSDTGGVRCTCRRRRRGETRGPGQPGACCAHIRGVRRRRRGRAERQLRLRGVPPPPVRFVHLRPPCASPLWISPPTHTPQHNTTTIAPCPGTSLPLLITVAAECAPSPGPNAARVMSSHLILSLASGISLTPTRLVARAHERE